MKTRSFILALATAGGAAAAVAAPEVPVASADARERTSQARTATAASRSVEHAPRRPTAKSAPSTSPSPQQLRQAVQAHRQAERDQTRRDEAIAGRRLTPAERAQLREQLHSEWRHPVRTPVAVLSDGADDTRQSWRAWLPWHWQAE